MFDRLEMTLRAALGAATVTWAVLLAAPSYAAEQSSAMLRLIEILHENGTIDSRAYDALRSAALAEVAAGEKGGGVHVSVDGGGLEVSSDDGAFAFELGGRIHADAAWYHGENDSMGNGSEMRRVRLEWGGTLWRDWQYKGQVDLAGDEVSLKSTYIRYLGLEPVAILAGNFKESYSLERLTSSNDTTFMERAAASTAFSPGRNIGVAVTTGGAEGLFRNASWTATAGLFTQGENDGGPENEGWAVTGRATLAPQLGDDGLVHLGAALSYRDFGGTDTLRLRARPESHVTSVRLVDTGDLEDLDDEVLVGLEGGLLIGPLSLQGEYMRAYLTSDGPDPDFDGWYAYASWVLTGESRRYDARRGYFRGIKPKRNLSDGGLGAWEVALRYSNLDLNDSGVTGGEQDLVTLGLNWYPNPNLRFMANWIEVLDVDRPGSEFDGSSPEIFQLRAQVRF